MRDVAAYDRDLARIHRDLPVVQRDGLVEDALDAHRLSSAPGATPAIFASTETRGTSRRPRITPPTPPPTKHWRRLCRDHLHAVGIPHLWR